MATVRDLCTNALTNLGLDGLVTDGVPNEEIVDALRHFNNLVDFLESRRLWDPVFTSGSVSTNAAKVYVGPNAPSDGTPVISSDKVPQVIRAVVRKDTSGDYYPMTEITETEYLAYRRTDTSGRPEFYVWKPISGAYGEILFYMTPQDTYEFEVYYNQVSAGQYTLNDALDLKPGYQAYLEYELTVRLAKPLNVEVNEWKELSAKYWRIISRNRTQSSIQDQGDVFIGTYDIDSDVWR